MPSPLALCLGLLPQFFGPEEHAFDAVPFRTLPSLPAIELTAADAPPPPIRNTSLFTLVGESRIAFLRSGEHEEHLVLVSTNGDVLREIRVDADRLWSLDPNDAYGRWESLTSLGGDRVLLLANHASLHKETRPWFLPPTPSMWVADLRAGTVLPLGYAPMDLPREVAATGDGGFVIGTDYQGDSGLYAYDAHARLLWKREPGAGIESLVDLCVTTDGRIAMVDEKRGTPGVQFVGSDGRLEPRVALEDAWDEDVGKVSGISAGTNGLLCILTWRDAPELVTCTRALEPLATVALRHADGQSLHGTWKSSPSGRLWCSDGYAFFQVRDDGGIGMTVGEPRDGRNLRSVDIVRIGPDDRIYAVSARDKMLHVFDASGRRIRVVPATESSDPDLPRFGRTVPGRADEEDWPQVLGGRRWVCSGEALRIEGPAGEPVREFSPGDLLGSSEDGRFWLEGLAPDGSICVTARTKSKPAIFVLGSDGSTRFRWDLPYERGPCGVAFDGERFALSFEDEVVLFDRSANPLFRVGLEPSGGSGGCGMGTETGWRVHLAKHGTELWLYRGPIATRIERYLVP